MSDTESVGKKEIDWEPPTLDETIDKLKRNKYQYASAGDVRRLMEEIDRLQEQLEKSRSRISLLESEVVFHGGELC